MSYPEEKINQGQRRAETAMYENKNIVSPVVSVVKNEIYPEKRAKKNGVGRTPTFSKSHKPTPQNTIITDPNGSYTGTPIIRSETPVQDVDDL